jgi:pimeloyl-ACP methyl ester carboxylesterase
MSTAIAPAVTPCQRRYQLVGPPTVVVLLLLLLAGVLVGCGSSTHANSTATAGSGGLAHFYTQTLAWSSCAGIFQCTTLTVPLDYANPAGRTIQLAVIRARASDPAHRIGSLITNPGGPGGSGVEFVKQSYPAQPGQPSHFGPQLRADFDIVGFDPRGVGHSAPITCLSNTQLDHYFLYDSPTSWPTLRTALAMAMAGNGRALLTLSDMYNERNPRTGHYSNQSEANIAINCLDHPDPIHTVADVKAELPAYQQASPLVGASFAWDDLMCAYWPVSPQSQPHPVHYAGTPPILVVGTIHDPATPYPSALQMTDELRSAVLLTYNGDGHTAYHRGSSYINAAVDDYLTQAAIPATGTVCQPDSQPAS